MNKNEICEKLVTVCNTLNIISVTGIQNAGNLAGCHGTLQEVISYLISCDIITPEQKRERAEEQSLSETENGGG